MRILIDRLEKCLRAWEDYFYLVGRLNSLERRRGRAPLVPNKSAVAHYREFRKFLLSVPVSAKLDSNATPIDISRFNPPEGLTGVTATMANLPLMILSWNSFSRRVYRLTAELQGVLRATSLKGITWADVAMPFPAFAIELERPERDPEGSEFDLIVVLSLPVKEGTRWDFQLLGTECDLYQPARLTFEIATAEIL